VKCCIPGYGSPSPAESFADAADPLLRTASALLALWPEIHCGPVPLADYVSQPLLWTMLAAFYQACPRDIIMLHNSDFLTYLTKNSSEAIIPLQQRKLLIFRKNHY